MILIRGIYRLVSFILNLVFVKILFSVFRIFYRALSPNFGLRVFRNWALISIPLIALFFLLLSYFYYSPNNFSWNSMLVYLLASFIFIYKPLKLITRKRPSLSWILLYCFGIANSIAILYCIWQLLPKTIVTLVFSVVSFEERIDILSYLSDVWRLLSSWVITPAFDSFLSIQISIDDTIFITSVVFLLSILICYGIPFTQFILEGIKESERYKKWYLEGHASRWAGVRTFLKFPSRFKIGKRSKNVYMGRTRFEDFALERDLFTNDDTHLLTVGCSGSGKSLTSINPNLATYDGSMLVMDPKGEFATAFAKRRKELGQKVYVIDPFNITKSETARKSKASYNLLEEIDLDSSQGRKRLSAITSSMIPPSSNANSQSGNSKYWEESGRLIMDAVIGHVLTSYPKECHSLTFVSKLLIGRNNESRADPEKLDKLKIEMLKNPASGGIIQTGAMMIDQAGEREFGIMLTEIYNALKWTTDPVMSKTISRSDFKFADFEKKKMTVFLCLPFADMLEQSRWLKAMTSISLRIYETFEKKPNPRLLFILDELYQYADQLKRLSKDAVIMRSAGIKLWAFVQHYSQLVECLGASGAEDFESSSTVEVFGVRDNTTARWVQEKLGQKIVEKRASVFGSKTGETDIVNLMDASTVQTTLQKNSPYKIVFPSQGNPMLLERMSHKSVKVDGRRFRGLPFKGMYEEPKSEFLNQVSKKVEKKLKTIKIPGQENLSYS